MTSVRAQSFTCKVRAAGLTDPPQDCDWPNCGCDPYADKVLAALEEQAPGLFGIMRDNEELRAEVARLYGENERLRSELVTMQQEPVHVLPFQGDRCMRCGATFHPVGGWRGVACVTAQEDSPEGGDSGKQSA